MIGDFREHLVVADMDQCSQVNNDEEEYLYDLEPDVYGAEIRAAPGDLVRADSGRSDTSMVNYAATGSSFWRPHRLY